MIAYIDQYKHRYGVEPICRVLPIAPSTYHAAQRRPGSARAVRDRQLKAEITRIHAEHFGVYGARKVWRQLHREGIAVARCTVERLMSELGLEGVRRGKPRRTTTPEASVARPADLVERDFSAARPNQLWVADLTYVATWSGFVYVAFVIDAFSRLSGGLAGLAVWTMGQRRGGRPAGPTHPPPARQVGSDRRRGRRPRRGGRGDGHPGQATRRHRRVDPGAPDGPQRCHQGPNRRHQPAQRPAGHRAGQLLTTTGQRPERLRNEAAFAHLCGATAIPASSGKTPPAPATPWR
jgi:transposase InsO family protein